MSEHEFNTALVALLDSEIARLKAVRSELCGTRVDVTLERLIDLKFQLDLKCVPLTVAPAPELPTPNFLERLKFLFAPGQPASKTGR